MKQRQREKDRKTKQIKKDKDRAPPFKRQQKGGQQFLYANRKKMYHQIKQIDRSQQCPFLVRIFYAINDQNQYIDNVLPVEHQLRLHLWMNSTLKQISEIIRAILPSIRTKQKFFFWKLVFSKQKNIYQKIQLGWVYTSKRYDKVEEKALCHTKFAIGDMIDLAITYK